MRNPPIKRVGNHVIVEMVQLTRGIWIKWSKILRTPYSGRIIQQNHTKTHILKNEAKVSIR